MENFIKVAGLDGHPIAINLDNVNGFGFGDKETTLIFFNELDDSIRVNHPIEELFEMIFNENNEEESYSEIIACFLCEKQTDFWAWVRDHDSRSKFPVCHLCIKKYEAEGRVVSS